MPALVLVDAHDAVAEVVVLADDVGKALCDAQADLAARAAKPTVEFPVFLDYEDDAYAAVESAAAE
ncbi:MAG TPA: hypothetical protein VNS46_04815, partial [Nocardioides sp.]|nr:hypothetical protein [Nocardioides sp.]